MAKTFRLAATQVAFPWSDKGQRGNPYSDRFDPSGLGAHIERDIRLPLGPLERAGRMGALPVVAAEDMQRPGRLGQHLGDPDAFRSPVEAPPGPASEVQLATRDSKLESVGLVHDLRPIRPCSGSP